MVENKLDTIVISGVEYDIGSTNTNNLSEYIDTSTASLVDEEIIISSNDSTETYVKINNNGIYTKNIYDLEGFPIISDNELSLKNKTIVCFGDSLTEFADNSSSKRYSDYIQDITGANVINVGIGGTQFRQRTTPVESPTNSNEGYAGLDIINMVKAACSQNFTIVENAAQIVYEQAKDDNRAIVTRLKNIDWSKVDIVTVFAGTNDWNNASLSWGTPEISNINLTFGAINEIVRLLLTTYPHIKLFWFTPTVRWLPPNDFSKTVSYNVGDYVRVYSAGKYYKFINEHLGDFDENDVEEVSLVETRIPELFSDNCKKNNMTLEDFSNQIIEIVSKYHIPICNMYKTLGWNQYNFSNYFNDNDGTHPRKGNYNLAMKIIAFLTQNRNF